jgi:hypothetical protein
MNLTFYDVLNSKQPRRGYMHLCMAFHEDRSDSNEYVLAKQIVRGQWVLVYGGSYVLPTDAGFTIVRWAELPKLQQYDAGE